MSLPKKAHHLPHGEKDTPIMQNATDEIGRRYD